MAFAPLAALLFASAGCFSVGPLAHDGPRVTGTIAVSGPTFGTREIAPVNCATGESQLFLGADFTEAAGTTDPLTVRLAVEPLSGPGVKIHAHGAPFGATILVRPADCPVFHFSLDESGVRLNDYRIFGVTLELDCALPSGDRAAGRLAAPGCW